MFLSLHPCTDSPLSAVRALLCCFGSNAAAHPQQVSIVDSEMRLPYSGRRRYSNSTWSQLVRYGLYTGPYTGQYTGPYTGPCYGCPYSPKGAEKPVGFISHGFKEGLVVECLPLGLGLGLGLRLGLRLRLGLVCVC